MSQSSNDKPDRKQVNSHGLSQPVTDPAKTNADSPAAGKGSPSGAGDSLMGVGRKSLADTIPCPKCGAPRVARSRTRGLDIIRIRLLPQRPYRCLRCYHRFWQAEKFLADTRRAWTWLAIILLLLVLLLFNRSAVPGSAQRIESKRIVTGVLSAPTGAVDESIAQSLDKDQAGLAGQPASAQDTELQQKHRQIIEDVGFDAPAVENPSSDAADEEPVRNIALSGNEFKTEKSATNIELTEAKAESIVESKAEAAEATPNIELAKAEAAGAEREKQSFERQIDRQLAVDRIEQESLMKVEIAYYVEQWRKAWQAGDSAAYLAYYADEFVPATGISTEAWRQQRRSRVLPDRDIRLNLSDFKVLFSEDGQSSTVTFKQQYKARGYADNSLKELALVRDGQQWKIIAEREIQ